MRDEHNDPDFGVAVDAEDRGHGQRNQPADLDTIMAEYREARELDQARLLAMIDATDNQHDKTWRPNA